MILGATDWAPFTAAVIGALVGGFASFLGTVFVQRRELTRTARIRLYNELLPPLVTDVRHAITAPIGLEPFEELARVGTLAGKHEQTATRLALDRWTRRELMFSEQLPEGTLDQETGEIVPSESVIERGRRDHELRREVVDDLVALGAWLERKIR